MKQIKIGKAARVTTSDNAYDVPPPDSKQWPEEWYCMNVMCRRQFWREHGESEFCPACRKCLPPGRMR